MYSSINLKTYYDFAFHLFMFFSIDFNEFQLIY